MPKKVQRDRIVGTQRSHYSQGPLEHLTLGCIFLTFYFNIFLVDLKFDFFSNYQIIFHKEMWND